MFVPKILVFAGSLRKDSLNKKLALAAAQSAQRAGCDVTYLDLKDLSLPLYDGDLEKEVCSTPQLLQLKEMFFRQHGFIIASPEYNSSMSGVLKNTIDWISIARPNEKSANFSNKVALLLSASPGNLGGLRGLHTLRSVLENLKTLVLPEQLAIPKAHEAFTPEGALKDPKQQSVLDALIVQLTLTISKLNA